MGITGLINRLYQLRIEHNPEGLYRLTDVFEVLLTRCGEFEGVMVFETMFNRFRDADASRMSKRLEPGRKIHGIPVNIALIDNYFAKVDTDTKKDLSIGI